MKTIVLLLSLCVLASCTTVPKDISYGPLGPEGGYTSKRRGLTTFAVRYTGDQYMTGRMVRDLALLASAEIAMDAGYEWFVVDEKINESGHNLQGTSFKGVATAQTSKNMPGGIDTLTGSRTVQTKFISQYRLEIQCFREHPELGDALDAKATADFIRSEYGLEGGAEEPE